MKRTISVILMSAVIGTTVASAMVLNPVDAFAEEPVKPQKPGDDDEKISELKKAGISKGKEKAQALGEVKGKKDGLEKKSPNWELRYRELGNIEDRYNIGMGGEYLEGFLEGFKEAFEQGYGDGYIDVMEKQVIIEIGYAKETAEKDAISDYHDGKVMDYERRMLSEEDAIIRFKLTNESEEFKEYFYVEYMVEYEKAYEEKYRELRTNDFTDDRKGYEDGSSIGAKMGRYSGKFDFVTPNAPNDWESSFRKFEEQKSIIDRYFLDREVAEYRESFIIGFREAYKSGYQDEYRKLNVDISQHNIYYKRVTGKGKILEFREEEERDDGREEPSGENPTEGIGELGGRLKIDPATFYKETHIGISMERDSFNYNNLKYKPVNHVYNVAVENRGEGIKLDKPMTLELEYYGSERAGIYQLINDEWVYMYTHVSDKSIMEDKGSGDEETLVNENSSSDSKDDLFLRAEIPAGMFKGGKYAIFIDEDYKPIKDIRRHWANEELYTFLRRGYIKGDKHTNYYPNAAMFRGEFLDVLGKAMGWDYEGVYDDTSRFKDKNEFYGYKNAINYAANMGYVSGGTDGRFRPYDTITYNQVEWILKKVLYDGDFKWNSYEEQIRHDKFTNPESVKGKNKPIKRGEAIYMLHKIQQHNLI